MKRNIKHILCIGALSLTLIGCNTYYSDHLQGAVDGNAADEYAIATCYDDGDGGVPGGHADKAKAAEWYLKAAQKGHADAQNNLGLLYKKGEGVPRDLKKALEWFYKSAKQGNKYGQYNVGNTLYDYLNELGGIDEADIELHAATLNEAAMYLRLAHNNGVKGAQYYIEGCREKGKILQDFADSCRVKIHLNL